MGPVVEGAVGGRDHDRRRDGCGDGIRVGASSASASSIKPCAGSTVDAPTRRPPVRPACRRHPIRPRPRRLPGTSTVRPRRRSPRPALPVPRRRPVRPRRRRRQARPTTRPQPAPPARRLATSTASAAGVSTARAQPAPAAERSRPPAQVPGWRGRGPERAQSGSERLPEDPTAASAMSASSIGASRTSHYRSWSALSAPVLRLRASATGRWRRPPMGRSGPKPPVRDMSRVERPVFGPAERRSGQALVSSKR